MKSLVWFVRHVDRSQAGLNKKLLSHSKGDALTSIGKPPRGIDERNAHGWSPRILQPTLCRNGVRSQHRPHQRICFRCADPTEPATSMSLTAACLVKSLRQLLVDQTPLDVRTYAHCKPIDASILPSNPSAFTRIHFDSSVETIVPMHGLEVDTALWNAHMEMVKQAQSARTEC